MKKPKLKLIAAGLALTVMCMIAPLSLKAQVSEPQMDGVMGQSLKDETIYHDGNIGDSEYARLRSTASLFSATPASDAKSAYSQSFLLGSFLTEGAYTSASYYHKAAYKNYQLFHGIDVSWWQAQGKKTTLLDWSKIHDAGIDFAFVRVASRDSKDGSIYEDTAADSHIKAALKNNVNVGLYVFSQALTEKEAQEEAEFLLKQIKKYGWDVTLPLVIDRENGSYNRLVGGKLSKTKETAICQAFADTVTKAGYQASVYASYAWVKSYINTDKLENCGIWIARYNNTTTSNSKSGTAYADVPYDYDFWQYSSTAKVDGYSGSLDTNFWYKDTSIKTTGLKASAQSASGPVTLSWSKASEDVAGYRIYRYDEEQDKYVYLKATRNLSYEDENVTSGTTYQYKVRCYWKIGGKNYYGTYSPVVSVTTPPAKVTNVGTEKRSSLYLTLSWDQVSGASGYRIYQYNEDTKAYEKVTTISDADTTSYKITGLSSATEYQFKVRAYKKADGVTIWGSSSSVHREYTNPLKTKNLTGSAKASSVTLQWDKVTRASGYRVYRYNSTTKKYERIAILKGNTTCSYIDSKLKKGATVKYKVRAYKTYDGVNYYGAYADILTIKVK